MREQLVIYVSAIRTMGLLLLGCALVVGCYFCTTLPNRTAQICGWTGAVFFVFRVIAISRQLLDANPQVIVDEHGLEDRRTKCGVIEWRDVEALSIGRFAGTSSLCIALRDPKKYLGRLSRTHAMMVKVNAALGFQPMTLGFGGLTHSAEQVFEFIMSHYASDGVSG